MDMFLYYLLNEIPVKLRFELPLLNKVMKIKW